MRQPRRMREPDTDWLVVAEGDEAHVMPRRDAVTHEEVDCVCLPRVEPMRRYDGSFGWVMVHHSVDGREKGE